MTTTTTTQIQDLPDWMRDPLTRMIATGEELVQEPYPTYSGQRIAGFNTDQNNAFDIFRGVPTMGNPQVMESAQMVRDSGQSWANTNQSAYINPFMEAAINPAARRMEESYLKMLEAARARSATTGAFGGSRQALLETGMTRDFGRNLGDLYATGLADAYDRGMGAFGADQSRLLGAGTQMSNIGQLLQTMGIAGGNSLLQSGIQQRALDQAHLDQGYQDFIEQRNWPYGQLSFFNSLIRGVPQVGTVTTQSQQPEPNTASQILGAGIAGVGVLDKLSSLFD